jgi:hypothetical protein
MRIKNLSTLSLILAFGLAACNDSTGPNDDFDPSQSAADLAAVSNALDTDVYQSLSAMGGGFGAVAAAPALAQQAVDAGWIAVSSPDKWQRYGSAVVDAMSAAGAQAILIPDSFRGRTYEHHALEGWYHNPDRAGAPLNGIRFILYEVNPITGEPGSTEIGHVDVMDEGTETSAVVRLVVVSGEVEYINYTVSATGLIGSLGIEIDGFITDGTTQVDFTLNHTIDATFASARAEVDYEIAVVDRDFSMTANMVIEFDVGTETGSLTIDALWQQGSNSIAVQGSIDMVTDGGTLEVFVNGDLFATITLTGETISVVGADGGALSAAHAQALQNITDGLGDVFDDTFENFFDPVEWLFNIQF